MVYSFSKCEGSGTLAVSLVIRNGRVICPNCSLPQLICHSLIAGARVLTIITHFNP